MPFTGSHPAAVLPFLRTPLPASALVVGSIAPDVPFSLPVTPPWETHTACCSRRPPPAPWSPSSGTGSGGGTGVGPRRRG